MHSLSSTTPRIGAPERRQTIETAAAELFAEQGYAGTTIEQIVGRTGVSKPILYRHFESKQDLVMALLERHREELAAAPLAVIAATQGGSVPERLDAIFAAWFGYVAEHPFVRLLLHDASGDAAVAGVVEDLHDRQRAADVALLRAYAPHIPESELVPLGEAIRSALCGLGLWQLDHPDSDPTELVAAMRRLVLGLLAP